MQRTLRRKASRVLPALVAVGALAAGFAIASPMLHAEQRCGSSKDLMVRALERVRPDSPVADFQDALELLKHATSTCAGLGDAWYYRSLVERHLGHAQLADYALTKARLDGSDALDQKENPFVLSTTVMAMNVPPPAPGGDGNSSYSSAAVAAAAPPPSQPGAPAAAPAGSARSGSIPLNNRPVQPAQPAKISPSNAPIHDKWALVVGIGKFDDANVPALTSTTSDAKAFAALLSDPKSGRFKSENVHLLMDADATTKNIKEGLNWLARSAGPDDLVVIYVATHGSSRSMDTAGVNYIITHDTEITDQDALFATALPMVDVSNTVATRVRARRAAIFLDTCYSGGAVTQGAQILTAGMPTSSVSEETLSRISQGSGRVIVAASKVNEESWESQSLGHGYFTYFLLQGLKKNNGMDPLTDVFKYVQAQVSSRVRADWKVQQTPVMSQSSDGLDFALGTPPQATTAALSLPR